MICLRSSAIQFPSNALRKATEDGPSTEGSGTHAGVQDGVLGSWIQAGPDRDASTIWGVSQYTEFLSLSSQTTIVCAGTPRKRKTFSYSFIIQPFVLRLFVFQCFSPAQPLHFCHAIFYLDVTSPRVHLMRRGRNVRISIFLVVPCPNSSEFLFPKQ